MSNSKRFYTYFVVALLCLTACSSYKHVPYFQNSAEYDGTGKGSLYDMTIMPKDELVIFVNSPVHPESVDPFNFRDPISVDDRAKAGGDIRARGGSREHRYLVENDGTIDYPLVGRVRLAGLTIPQANALILDKIAPYVKDKSDCIVNTYIENYEISVLGEVKKPNTFTVSRNKCNILEALAMAGDMTIYGNRDNVKLLRELPNGEYEIHELDLRDANLLDSPYYYMQQRDVLYVEPNEVMAEELKVGRTTRLWFRGASIVLAVGSLLYRMLK